MNTSATNIPDRSAAGDSLLARLTSAPWMLLSALACLIPALFVFADINAMAIRVPFNDQWHTSLDIALATVQGRLSLADLFAQHGNHRVFFSNLQTAVFTALTNWDIRAETYMPVLLACVTFVLLALLVRRDYPRLTFVVLVPVSVLLFSLRGRHTWLTGFQSQFLYVLMFFIAALVAAAWLRVGWRGLLVTALLTFCSAISLTNGLLAWGLLLPVLLARGYRKPGYIIFWLVLAAGSFIFFFSGYRTEVLAARSTETGRSIGVLVNYTLVWLGGAFAPPENANVRQAILAGAMGLVLLAANLIYAWFTQHRPRTGIITLLMVAGFSFGSAALTAVGRAAAFAQGAGQQPLSERYIIHGVVWWIALVILGAVNVREASQRVRGAAVHALLIVANLVALLGFGALNAGSTLATLMRPSIIDPQANKCVLDYVFFRVDDPACVRLLSPQVPLYPRVLERTALLADNEFAIFAGGQQSVPFDATTLEVITQPQATNVYRSYQVEGRPEPVFFQHPDSVAHHAMPPVYLPGSYVGVWVETAVYVDRTTLALAGANQDGVAFTLSIENEAGDELAVETVIFDPHVNPVPIPISLQLPDEVIGQPFRIVFETYRRQNATYDWAMWVAPHLVFFKESGESAE